MSEPDFQIVLKVLPGWHTSGVMRLRAALKVLLRGFGLRAVEVRPIENFHTKPKPKAA